MGSLMLILASAAIFPGIVVRIKAIASGRKGAGIFQTWFDIFRLLQKGSKFSTTTSFVFQIAMSVYFGAMIMAILFVPFDSLSSVMSFRGDFVFFSYVIGMGKMFLVLSAMDTGSGFEGMGANREALYSLLVEPAFFVVIGTLAMFTGYTSFADIFAHLHYTSYFAVLVGYLAVYLLAQITLVENSRLPVDDPKTHLELTMVHEVIVLDHSGFDLALVQTASALRFAMYGTLIASCVVPSDWGIEYKLLSYFVVQVCFAVFVGVIESFRSRSKLANNPQYILKLVSLAIVLFFTVMIINNNL